MHRLNTNYTFWDVFRDINIDPSKIETSYIILPKVGSGSMETSELEFPYDVPIFHVFAALH
jgi:hypothetical protein